MAANSALSLSLKLRTKRQKTLERNINKSLTTKINKGLSNIQRELTKGLRRLIHEKIVKRPEYISLISATLRGEFGLENPEQLLGAIIEIFLQSFKTELKLANIKDSTFFAKLSIQVKVDFERLANLPEAFQPATNDNSFFNGGSVDLLPWLRWILLEGTAPLVLDHSVVRDQGRGRSGLNFLMSYTPGQNYAISKRQFTGTENDNFLTRAITENSEEIQRYIRKTSSELMRRSFKV